MLVFPSIGVFFLIFNINRLAYSEKICTTPNNQLGICIDIRNCSNLWQLSQTNAYQDNVQAILWNALCSRENTHLAVCCDSKNVPNDPAAPNDKYGVAVISEETFSQLETNVKGGKEAQLGQFPWMASIQMQDSYSSNHICGGCLISEYYVLTAAHCVYNRNAASLKVRLGDVDLNETASDLLVSVKKVIVYENFDSSDMIKVNDIALLQLHDAVPLNFAHRPICLPTRENFNLSTTNLFNKPVQVAGWGATYNSMGSVTRLLYANLAVTKYAECRNEFKQKLGASIINQKHICAISRDEKGNVKADACKGDSGGPLMWKNPWNGKYLVIGIVSSGYGCGSISGLYTRVTAFVDWIQKNMN